MHAPFLYPSQASLRSARAGEPFVSGSVADKKVWFITGAGQRAVDRFGRIDVLVNNAGNFFAGFFEELSPQQFEQQLATNLGVAGADAVATVEQNAHGLLAQVDAYRDPSSCLAVDEP